MQNPRVSGDRILFDYSNGTDNDTWVVDARVSRVGLTLPFVVANSSSDDFWGRITGNNFVYLSNGYPYWAKLAVPGLTINSLPTRIARSARVTLVGKLTDQGLGVGGVALRVERRSASGTWDKIASLTTAASGAYTYKSPKNTVKTSYRIAYDGSPIFFGPTIGAHFSAVSSARVAWPR